MLAQHYLQKWQKVIESDGENFVAYYYFKNIFELPYNSVRVFVLPIQQTLIMDRIVYGL